ncbi:MAG: DUF4124 domain-containing protein [Candidatus Nitronauta litoralis]|uniref:DUF4124 domain-containing protein n=1 Tax=Candidatus Nitronauta litoralis TaxID=2705533 RepID=A0A7T0BVD9_9BACT|nr:MAG: DUF4124 domain-containing protein [Candidatus Nitronauta litoralis]
MRLLLGILIFVLLPGVAWADFFKYTDDQGKTHYVDSAAKVPLKYRQSVKHKVTPDRPQKATPSKAEVVGIIDDMIAENKRKQAESQKKIRRLESEIDQIDRDRRALEESVRNKRR